jgi:hypothetical protein
MLKSITKRDMIKFTIVRRVMVEEIYEVVANQPAEAVALAKAGEGLQESFKVEEGTYRVENMETGYYK